MRIWVGMPEFDSMEYEVFLDGQRVDRVLEADEESGRVWVAKTDKEGRLVYGYGNKIELNVIRGKVEIRKITKTTLQDMIDALHHMGFM